MDCNALFSLALLLGLIWLILSYDPYPPWDGRNDSSATT